MEFSINPEDIQAWDGSVLILGLCEGDLEKQLKEIKAPNWEAIPMALKVRNFNAKAGEITEFNLFDHKLSKLILVGLGKPKELQMEGLRKAAALGARASVGITGKLGIIFPWNLYDHEEAAKVTTEAIRLSLFKDLRFKNEPEQPNKAEKIELIGLPTSIQSALTEIGPICQGVELARELVGAPPNSLTPDELAKTALLIAKDHDLEVKILDRDNCNELGMGAYLAVAQGSDLSPKFIHLIYQSKKPIKHRLAMVGKGLTFDSGGYNLKVGAAQIDLMKFDMGGSAAVLGAARALGEIQPEGIEVHFIIAACENMINGSAVHPGDIVKASNGKTIEINNTDAEGRLTLADALVYAGKIEPQVDAIVDLATLTGACVIALGDEVAGLWSDNEQLAEDLIQSANSSGEGLWRMPLISSYKEGLKSILADIKNTGPRAGGSITAGLFLKEFVRDSIPWAHIDIAGTVWADKDKGINPAGATGYGVRTLVKWACNHK